MQRTYSLSVLACTLYLLAVVEMRRDLSSPYNDPCGGSSTQAHYGDIAVVTTNNVGAGREKRGATAIRERLWPNARVPYQLDPRYSVEERNRIYSAMRVWEENTCIRFYERPADHNASYLYIFKGGCCASYVGRQTENLQQGVSLGDSCPRFSTALHELGHAIGFWHEQSRPDRDEYINLLMDNVMPGAERQFEIEEQINSLGVGYDYNSIMHYSSTAFGAGSTTIQAHDESIPVGGAVELSELDILQANLLYSCDTDNFPPMETPLIVADETTEMPPLPECSQDFVNIYSGDFFSPEYPDYSHNQDCAYRISVPEGMVLNVTIIDLNLEWSDRCEKDSLTIYNNVDGSRHPQWYSRCGSGSDMSVIIDGTVAYVKYVTDGENRWEGRRGFYAAFNAEDINECKVDNGGCSQHCENREPGYVCQCDPGWFLSGDLKTCFDMNECAMGNGGCQYKCKNSGGSFTCECPEGSELNADGRTCTNPETSCDVDNGGCDQICSQSSMGVSCHCMDGYRLLSDGHTCVDINECVEGNTCSYGGCINTPGSYDCICHSGYEMDPTTETCINVDECSRHLHLCAGDSVCQDTEGSYECTCREGLKVSNDGLNCIDVNECQESSPCSHGCLNTYGSYDCVCLPGYQLEAIAVDRCVDIDECLEGACSDAEGATCLNTEGSFECQCPAGYQLSSDQQTCEDVNECSEQPNYCAHGCSNTDGSFECTCNPGYMLAEDGHSCKCGGIFTETSGSFSTPGWPISYPQQDFECEWIVDLTNPEATIQFTIDESAYGINGRSPCPTDYVMFFDGMSEDSSMMNKLCKYDLPDTPIITSTSQGKVMFSGTRNFNRPSRRVGVRVMFSMVEPVTIETTPSTDPPTTSVTTEDTPSTNPSVSTTEDTPSTNPPVSTTEDTPSTNPSVSTTEDTPSTNPPVSTTEDTPSTNPSVSTSVTTEDTPSTNPPVSTSVTTEDTPSTSVTTTEDTSSPDTPVSTTAPPVQLINECAVNNGGCQHNCVDTIESYYCTCDPGYILDEDGHSCKCGGVFTEATGSFSTPGWPIAYPQKDLECEWIVDLPNPDATIQFTIDESDYGINGRDPCPSDYVKFIDGLSENDEVMHKLCKFDVPDDPIITSTSQGRVVFSGTRNLNRPSSRVGVRVTYHTIEPAVPTSTQSNIAPSTVPPPVRLIDECAVNNGGCEHDCVDTVDSYYCECHSGYALEEDGHSCRIACGGILTERQGSFQTPYWPDRYPQENFVCEWQIRRPLDSQLIRFTIDDEHYGISGRPPCETDYLQFFSGSGQTNPVGDRKCFLRAPEDAIIVTNAKATVIFKGTANKNRPQSRVGVKVNYVIL